MQIKIISKSGQLPTYETEGSACMDIKAFLEEPVSLMAGERKLIPTGLFIELPASYEAQIRARSGFALKYGVSLANGVGTIDSDYRGEIGVALINFGKDEFVINNGDRIAQIIISKFERVEWNKEEELSITERGSGGFGHTGF
jgi:dUTP pyrophosphatase